MITYRCISVPATANWWLRSPNASNSNNFCNVNTDGTINNNNANNSNGVAPDFILIIGSITVALKRRKTFNERRDTSLKRITSKTVLLMLKHGRFLHGSARRKTEFHVFEKSSLGTLNITTVRKANT